MEALVVYLSVVTLISLIVTMTLGMKVYRSRLKKYKSRIGMFFLLTTLLSVFETVSVIYITIAR